MHHPPLRIAHRGMPRRERENTLPSFAAALAAGAQGIELDVHATADGVVVVHHDAVTREGMTHAASPWRELHRADVPRVRHAAVPTLPKQIQRVAEPTARFA